MLENRLFILVFKNILLYLLINKLEEFNIMFVEVRELYGIFICFYNICVLSDKLGY